MKFNLGGHINHALYWDSLAPISKGGGVLPAAGKFKVQVEKDFGSFDRLIEELSRRSTAVMGSGWGWLGYDRAASSLRLLELPNQETLGPEGCAPLLTIDVWEHAYYLDYKNVRAEYVKQIWKIVNWKKVEERYNSVIKTD
jgi:Fe-Mn family superoxide dismutase